MENIRESKEFKQLERALVKRLRGKLDPDGSRKVRPDAVVKDLVRRYMDAWVRAENARRDIDLKGDFCTDDRDRRYDNPSVRALEKWEGLMSRLQKDMDIKTEDLAAAMEDEDDEL